MGKLRKLKTGAAMQTARRDRSSCAWAQAAVCMAGGIAAGNAAGAFPIMGRIVGAATASARRRTRPPHHAHAHRVLRLRRHRHHRRDLRQLDPVAVRDQAAPRAPAVHRHGRQGAPGRCARSTTRPRSRAGGRSSSSPWSTPRCSTVVEDRLQGLVLDMFNTFVEPLEVEFGDQVEPPHRPLLRRLQEPGVQRPHRGDQLLPRARRRPVDREPRRGRRDPGRREPQRQDADLALPGDAARHQGGELPADPGGLRARQLPSGAGAASKEVLRPDDRPRAAERRSATSAGRTASTRAIENCRYEVQRGRGDDAARRHRAGCRRRTSRSRRSRPRSCATCGPTG